MVPTKRARFTCRPSTVRTPPSNAIAPSKSKLPFAVAKMSNVPVPATSAALRIGTATTMSRSTTRRAAMPLDLDRSSGRVNHDRARRAEKNRHEPHCLRAQAHSGASVSPAARDLELAPLLHRLILLPERGVDRREAPPRLAAIAGEVPRAAVVHGVRRAGEVRDPARLAVLALRDRVVA